MYGSGNLLNIKKPETYWFNMGYWKDTDDFITANIALANLLLENIEIDNISNVIDFGIGSGDQVLHYTESFTSLNLYVGLSYEDIQSKIAFERLNHLSNVNVIQGDASDSNTWFNYKTRENVSYKPESFDLCISLDSAYHFNTRYKFLQNAFTLLKPNGTLSMTDILIRRESYTLKVLAYFGAIPQQNLVTAQILESQMLEIGFKDIQIVDISIFVFNGLAEFIKKQSENVGSSIGWLPFQYIMLPALQYFSRGDSFLFVKVNAKRPS